MTLRQSATTGPITRPGDLPATSLRVLVRTLWRVAVVRGITAFAIGAYVVFRDPASASDVARSTAAYWLVDGIATVWTSRIAGAVSLTRLPFLVRGAVAIAAGLILLGRPADILFGPWQPGRGLVWIWVAALVLMMVGIQLAAGVLDVVICRRIRGRMPWDWSVATGAAFSAVLSIGVAALFAASPALIGRVVAASAILAGFGLVVGAARLDESRAASLSTYSTHQ
jgi:uncharacterized membrane protein HdeD (DUF308 family)